MRVQIVAQQDAAPVGDRALAEQGRTAQRHRAAAVAGRAGRAGVRAAGARSGAGDRAGRARPASSTPEQYDPGQRGLLGRDGNVQAGADAAQQRAGERAEAPGGVKPDRTGRS